MTRSEVISETFCPQTASVQKSARFVSARVVVVVFIVGGAVIGCASPLLGASLLAGLAIYSLIAGPICLAAILSRVRQVTQAIERTIGLNDGRITLITARKEESYSLDACCWFRGKATDDSELSYQPIRRRAIVIVFPTGRTIACGLDDTLYVRWLSALGSGQCRRVLRQEGIFGVVFFGLVLIGLVVGAFSGWCLGRELQNVLAPWLGNNPIVALAPAILAILLAWLFAVLPWFIPGWRRHTELERQQFIRSAILFPSKAAILAGAVLGGGLAGGIGLAAGFGVLFLVLTRWIIRTPADRTST